MQTYSISLDDVDIALLPLRVSNDFLKKEYYHFTVAEEPDHVTEVSDASYKCHTCAIDVPAAFAREHTASLKHRANSRIADAAIQRVRANITTDPVPMVRSSARFCANCATTVDGDHEKTKEHQVAAMHDNLLWELSKAYAGDVEDDKSCEKNADMHNVNSCQKNNEVKNVEDNKYRKESDNDNNKNDNAQTVKINAQTAENSDMQQNMKSCENNRHREMQNGVTIDAIQNINSTANPSTSHTNTTGSLAQLNLNANPNTVENANETKPIKVDYEKELRKFIDANNPYEFKEVYNRIQIKINDETLDLYSDHFHGYHRFAMRNYNSIECIVCSCTLKNKDTASHKYNLNHMSVVAKIGKDNDYIRKINVTHSHCILCNQKIRNTNVDHHKLSSHHVNRRNNCVRRQENVNRDGKNNVTRQENVNRECVDEIEPPYEVRRGEIWCLVCQCKVPKDARNRKDHLAGARHVNNMK